MMIRKKATIDELVALIRPMGRRGGSHIRIDGTLKVVYYQARHYNCAIDWSRYPQLPLSSRRLIIENVARDLILVTPIPNPATSLTSSRPVFYNSKGTSRFQPLLINPRTPARLRKEQIRAGLRRVTLIPMDFKPLLSALSEAPEDPFRDGSTVRRLSGASWTAPPGASVGRVELVSTLTGVDEALDEDDLNAAAEAMRTAQTSPEEALRQMYETLGSPREEDPNQ